MARIKGFHYDLNNILAAAEAILATEGLAHLSLQAVAARAGLSKGGLMHHFPTRQALVEALVERAAQGFRDAFAQSAAAEAGRPWPTARGLLRLAHASLAGAVLPGRVAPSAVPLLLAAAAQDKSLLRPVGEAMATAAQQMQAEGVPPAASWALLATVNGLGFEQSVPLALDRERALAALAYWEQWIDQATASAAAEG